ncbi:RNA-binding protein [Desulfobacter hydrogenophilus]|uniref:RNA-binding protein KhpB n=1 Tax=Desulfobacter hydrogenophilus TaxID=2291 RepID=A0A328FEY4_9BACT|nr:RNA-binding cell elongation regulator Jag/EloR [Desulfobacter hydrogenophilus]NDY73200.1 KH domain-containing protein [Desulfobacter hydrogenophilus]QBH12516.1 KH domain-containing protein [Desulfobacter hydrogenophilus]RAM03251.1 RNA-binding protein [Desulfobacter hydrogenophilus]
MNQPLEFTGKNVNSAIEAACRQLNIPQKELKYNVISSGTTGIFGIVGRKDARIRVTVPGNKTQQSKEDKEGILSIVDEAFGQNKPTPEPKKVVPEPKKPEPKPKPIQEKEPKEVPDSPDKKLQKPENEPKPEAEDTGRWDAHPAPRSERPNKEELPPEPVSQASIDLGIEAVQKMADLITEDAHVEAITEENKLTLQINGGNTGILIGRKGQTLDAMQFLTDKIINRQSESRVRVKVDIEGYMETRKANLKHLALKMAEKAKKTGRPATINQMSAQDRRIVHLALKDDAQVRTQSMGDGYYRRLVIFPKKRNSYKGKKRFKK